ncbi:MAG: CO dehydrogenase/CO-methylating acetyl-CoA synthase complex subunit beta [Actinobacteria bacterium]|nr:CO dehydrogenase/CO-methylating acetyl-CoA synthase complex subunit beta [Actinomycetota bacterium]MBU1944079.1 CO dehydrogenase/CO-methylating acetyl-CoA synthase complex subunit beta [Actinomycetota bacterium]MBU2687267.1 CO dehydrogenase/CO-methylating acetyl-CoA synthase complex subunit beta [Actinomycetota bacterium]
MSKIIASAAIRGAHAIHDRVAARIAEALEKHGENQEIEFPNTAYYLPIIYGMTGEKVATLADCPRVMKIAEDLLPPVPPENLWTPYLGPALDAGMATLFMEEIEEAIKYVDGPNPVDGIWLGAADDVIMRERGVEFVDGTAPGFCALIGSAPDPQTAESIVKELQEKNLYVWTSGNFNGTTVAEQLDQIGVQLGWETRIVPYGREIGSAVYSLGFAARAAMSFGGANPGDFRKVLLYNKNRIFAFVLALGEVTDEWYANAAGAINYGFPTIADTPIPEILPTGVCTYEHVVSDIPHDQIVQKAIEVRGLKIQITKVPIPMAYGPAFEGERIRKEDMYVQFGGNITPAFEFVEMKEMDEVEDGKITVVGPEIDDVEQGAALPMGIVVHVAGRKMQEDFESILERQCHHLINGAEGIWHMGQRDIVWTRISTKARDKGFKIRDYGEILHAKLLGEFPAIVDKVEVTIYTNDKDCEEWLAKARDKYQIRDERTAGMTDETTDIYYSCTLCQSFAPTHVCVVTPERLGLCGAYNWLDCKAAYEIDPTGPNQPIPKGEAIDEVKGQWKNVNEFVWNNSGQKLDKFNAYTMMEDPMTSCGCFECIVAFLPIANGVMIVNREFTGKETPCGMSFSTLAGSVGGGNVTPGFVGIGKVYITSKKFISADGGFHRIVWMPKELKETLHDQLQKRAEELETPDFIDKIADETIGVTEEEILPFLTEKEHPALTMDPMLS